MTSFVMIWDGNTGECIKSARYTLSPKKALIAAVMQYNGNYNTWEYPKDIKGIYKSKFVKGRLIYDISDRYVMYSQ